MAGRAERVLDLLEQEFTDCCESPEMGSGNQALGAPEGAVSILTTEPPQPPLLALISRNVRTKYL